MYHGIINVYKEKGYTSHDVVAILRGVLKQKKIGHTGTLDPDATGVLPVCLGKGTKVAGLLTDKDKVYKVTFCLGKSTDTEDHTGEVTGEKDWSHVTPEQVMMTLKQFLGDIEQVPPMYSAIKMNGKKLYELAREGISVERPKRPVTIYKIDGIDIDLPNIGMTVRCSKGTYIRSLCRDISTALGTCGHMTSLERTGSGAFDLSTANTIDAIKSMVENGTVESAITPVDVIFSHYEQVIVGKEHYKLLDNGAKMHLSTFKRHGTLVDEGMYNVYNEEKDYIGLYRWRGSDQLLIPVKFFNIRHERG